MLRSYLPDSPSAESLGEMISDVIAGLSEDARSGRGAAGAVMKGLWERLGEDGRAVDRKEVGKMVGEALKGKR